MKHLKDCPDCEGTGYRCAHCDKPFTKDICSCGSIARYRCDYCLGEGEVEMTDEEIQDEKEMWEEFNSDEKRDLR